MKIIILGAGAIGSFVGAKLSFSNDAVLIGSRKHVNAINKKGLKITGIENKRYKIKAKTRIDKIDNNTLIILTTKAYDNESSIEKIKNLLKRDTIILCLQNGIGNEDVIKNIIKNKCAVLRGITTIGCTFFKNGVVSYNNKGIFTIEKSENQGLNKKLLDIFKKANFNIKISNNIKKDIWKKAIVNCVLNPLTAILKIENKKIASNSLKQIKKSIIRECLLVAKKEGIKFNIDFLKLIDNIVKGSNNKSSMLQDILKGKKTEIEFLNGKIVELGRKYKIKTQINEALTMAIKRFEKHY